MASCYKKDHKIIRIQINSEFSSGPKNRISPLFVESPDFFLGVGGGEGGGRRRRGFPDFPLSRLAGLRPIAILNNYNL